jgi:hypothetical protein
MLELILPTSDVVDARTPYVVRVRATQGSPIRDATGRASLRRAGAAADAGAGLAAIAQPAPGRARERGDHEATTVELTIDVSAFAVGEYIGELSVEADGRTVTTPVAFFRTADGHRDAIPFGIYAVPYPASRDGQDDTLRTLAGAGIDLLCMHMDGLERDRAFLDRAARFGLRFCPSTNLGRRPDHAGPDAWPLDASAQLAAGAPSFDPHRTPLCFNRPDVRAHAADALRARLAQYRAHPAFSGRVYYGDDLFMAARIQMGKAWLSCYCDTCRADFRHRFGFDPPLTTETRRSVVPASDPWLSWMRYRCRTVYGDFVRRQESAKGEVDPAVEMGLCHGWPDNPFTSVATGLYAPLTQPTTVVSSYFYPFLRSPAADFIAHYEIARMGNRGKDVWMLGVCGADRTVAPGWHVRQNYWNMLAAGYRFIAFFSWHDYHGLLQGDDARQKERVAESFAALSACGRHKDWVFPAARHWERAPATVAALYSFTTEAFDIEPEYRGHLHSKRVCAFYREALRRQVAVDILCEEEVREGLLERYESLCLPDARSLPDDVHRIICEYAAAGRLVLTDPDYLYTDSWHPNVKPPIKGSVEAAPESMAGVLAGRAPRRAIISNPDITMRVFQSGDADVFVFVNNAADRYWGMGYSYGSPDENYARAALVRDDPARATVTFAEGGRTLFDLETGERAGTTDDPLDLALEPSWGRVLIALAVPKAPLRVSAPATVRQGGRLRCAIAFGDAPERPVRAGFTVRTSVRDPSGRPSAHGGFSGVRDGEGVFELPIGINDEPGTWTLTFEGGFPRAARTVNVTVERAASDDTWLRARWV